MSKLSIKLKLILLFILIKVLPLLIIIYISYGGIKLINEYMEDSTRYLSNETKQVILETANLSIKDSIRNLDKKSQNSLERLSVNVAENIANFLKQRDRDLLFLSTLPLNDEILKNFYKNKNRNISIHSKFKYDEFRGTWISTEKLEVLEESNIEILNDNKKEFNYIKQINIKEKTIPLYKEITVFDLQGKEIYKISSINSAKLDISKKNNTYINSETYFNELEFLQKDDIYVSELIGEYVNSKVIGLYNKKNTKKNNLDFKPEFSAYAGKENPLGREFEGLIRFITPLYKNNKKIAYVSLALDHKHIMEFTDNINPTGNYVKKDIIDASTGNYAFLLDEKGRVTSHIRDYFISGFNKETGKRVTPWTSKDVYEKFTNSKEKDFDKFLRNYPKYNNQSLRKRPNLEQIKKGDIPIECAYLNFAPQCHGWMHLTKNSGHGSFVIYWSGIWKLVTAAPIPYYTGRYKDSKRGFGIVSIGANTDTFHSASNKTKESITEILDAQNDHIEEIVKDNKLELNSQIKRMVNELSFSGFMMIVLVIAIAILMSNYISSKINKLLIATKKFANNEFDYKINISSNDEIGNLENSFNEMASKIDSLIKTQKKHNTVLTNTVEDKTKELKRINENLEHQVELALLKNRQKDAQLIQNSKMAAMGEMISMIIHQWKQPLNTISIINSSQKFKHEIGDLNDKELLRNNASIKKQIELMSDTMDDFRNFFSKREKALFSVDIMLNKTLNLIEQIYIKQGIKINYVNNLKEDVQSLGYENELIQVLINILNNSRDEILYKKVTITDIHILLTSNEDKIYITIEDFAGGIAKDIIDNIFKAYFTTKNEDKGTGLGLYMSKTILEKVNGNIVVSNKEYFIQNKIYKGASFKIILKKENNNG